MNDEQYEEIINRLVEQLAEETVGSDRYEKVAEQLRYFEELRQANEQVRNEYCRIDIAEKQYIRECEVEEYKAELEADSSFREQMIRLGLGAAGAVLVFGLSWLGTGYTWTNPITNKAPVELASSAMNKWLAKLI